jgi:hypothetical protein
MFAELLVDDRGVLICVVSTDIQKELSSIAGHY